MKSRITVLLLTVVLLFSFSGCNKKATENSTLESEKDIIAVSIAPQETFLEKVCGNDFEVITVIPAGASPETYEPTPADMQKLQQAKIYFAIGVPSEDNSILPTVSNETKIVSLHEMLEKSYQELEINGERDPHIWLSPKRVMAIISIMSEIMGGSYPENAQKYNSNALSYIEELGGLDSEIRELVNPKAKKDFIVFHPSLGYFAEDYGLSMHALEQDGKEATAKRLAEMTDFAKQRGIKTIFYQAENSGKQASAFAAEIDGEAICFEPLSADYINSMKSMAKDIAQALPEAE